MEKQKIISIDSIEDGTTIYMCGDHDKKGCCLGGKFVINGPCLSCFYKSGTIGKNCIKKEAVVYDFS